VRPGDRIAADGEIIDGESAINEAPLTGESVPVVKGRGLPYLPGPSTPTRCSGPGYGGAPTTRLRASSDWSRSSGEQGPHRPVH